MDTKLLTRNRIMPHLSSFSVNLSPRFPTYSVVILLSSGGSSFGIAEARRISFSATGSLIPQYLQKDKSYNFWTQPLKENHNQRTNATKPLIQIKFKHSSIAKVYNKTKEIQYTTLLCVQMYVYIHTHIYIYLIIFL